LQHTLRSAVTGDQERTLPKAKVVPTGARPQGRLRRNASQARHEPQEYTCKPWSKCEGMGASEHQVDLSSVVVRAYRSLLERIACTRVNCYPQQVQLAMPGHRPHRASGQCVLSSRHMRKIPSPRDARSRARLRAQGKE
jgi:hypothetical protein